MSENQIASSDAAESAGHQLACEIKKLRHARGLSQPQLAQLIGYTRQYVSLAERPTGNLPSQELVWALDNALDAGGVLFTLRARAKAEQEAVRRYNAPTPPRPAIFDSTSDLPGPAMGDFTIDAPAGRRFAGSTITAKSYPASDDDGRILAAVPPGFVNDPFLKRPRRALVIGATPGSDGTRLFGLDNRRARDLLSRAVEEAPILIPRAYELDDLTLGILWAITNLDEGLLDDDAELAAINKNLRKHENEERSAGSRDLAAEMSEVAQMWLGSSFCARHIIRHAGTLSEEPAFWTREQRGEEASVWLLFVHKFDYLRRSLSTFNHRPGSPTRYFCVPHSTVADSGPSERILFLLAVALMESFGIQTRVCVEPEYSGTPGFVLERQRRAIVANWLNGDGIWDVDMTDNKGTLRTFADASAYASAHSITSVPDPANRLRALSDYLDLNWSWLVRRCGELAEYGCAGFAQPRSRLLSLDGLDQACRYLGEIGR